MFSSRQCIETIKSVNRDLCEAEDEVMKEKDEGERLNFGLVQVVYEWARNVVIEKTNLHIFFLVGKFC